MARISAGIGNYGSWFARGSFNTAVVDDKLAVRVNIMSQEHDGYSRVTIGLIASTVSSVF